jgi:hypothetical protein
MTLPQAMYNGAAIAAHSARQVSEWVGPRCLTRSPRMNMPTIRTGIPSSAPTTPNDAPAWDTRARR